MPNITLIKVLMALKSKRFSERQLFLCIVQEFKDGPVLFQYSLELEDEADGIIPVIPLYLEGKFGQGIRKWMKPSATIGTAGYEYDIKSNKVVPHGNNILNNLNEDWEQRINKYDYDDYSLSDVGSEDEQGGFAIEFGELDFDNNKKKSNLNDDSASLGTMGIQFPPEFIHEDSDKPKNIHDNPIQGIQQGIAHTIASLVAYNPPDTNEITHLKASPSIET